jgi:hypothetical protein
MKFATSALSWLALVLLIAPLAILLLRTLPTGAVLQTISHVVLLVAGAAVAMLVRDELRT